LDLSTWHFQVYMCLWGNYRIAGMASCTKRTASGTLKRCRLEDNKPLQACITCWHITKEESFTTRRVTWWYLPKEYLCGAENHPVDQIQISQNLFSWTVNITNDSKKWQWWN
jgi:hypothetical protein